MESGGGKIKRGADRHYSLMKTKDISALPISEICEENAHLYLWVTNNFLADGLQVMKDWGFRYVTNIAWIKGDTVSENSFSLQKAGLGQYFRGRHELCLFGVKGRLPYKVNEQGKRLQGHSAFVAPRNGHSEKPQELMEMIEKVSYGPYIELFARKETIGWDSWGDELNR